MKKTAKKSPSKAAHKKAVKDLDVKTAKGKTVRGGEISIPYTKFESQYKP